MKFKIDLAWGMIVSPCIARGALFDGVDPACRISRSELGLRSGDDYRLNVALWHLTDRYSYDAVVFYLLNPRQRRLISPLELLTLNRVHPWTRCPYPILGDGFALDYQAVETAPDRDENRWSLVHDSDYRGGVLERGACFATTEVTEVDTGVFERRIDTTRSPNVFIPTLRLTA